ncbi:phosphotransferase enzyme family protein [Kribbella sp. DT2]|uniref:phosphotransferase enzyme family protein n=1 Tax=Kribbella sp. DT2 TaxID=3393427 RepID=UPI003CF699D2
MHEAETQRAVTAARAIASSLGLSVEDAIVLNNSNKLALRLVPCEVMARVAPIDEQNAQFEIDLAQHLADVGSPVAALEPRVEPLVYERDGFAVTLWTYYATETPVSPAVFAEALEQLHAGMRKLDDPAPRYLDRVEEAQQLLADRDSTPELPDAERELLSTTLRNLKQAIAERHPAEQLLHGEPHPGNILNTEAGPLFIDLETCCRGPVEFDLAHAPEEVSEHYPDLDQDLLRDCRILMLAIIITWRWDKADQLPDGRRLAAEWLAQLRTALAQPHG